MVQLNELQNYCNALLQVQDFRDYCPNGLQVEGKSVIKKLVSGVTASQAFIDQAIAAGADALLVHHGYFWKNEDAAIVGMKKQRIHRLLEHEVSLLAYHLPLDAHAEFGNNAQLAARLHLQVDGVMRDGPASGLIWYGKLASPMLAHEFAGHLEQQLQRTPLHLSATTDRPISRVAWCTGGAQGYFETAAALGVDAYISGEASEQTFHLARELDVHYFGAGHHATERYGVQALAAHLAQKFDLQTEYIDIHNPV